MADGRAAAVSASTILLWKKKSLPVTREPSASHAEEAVGWLEPCDSDNRRAVRKPCGNTLEAKIGSMQKHGTSAGHVASHKAFVEACPTSTRLAELALVMVPVSLEAERLFSALKFIKSCVGNRLKNPHLSVALRLFFSKTFDVETLTCDRALKAWKQAASSRERYEKVHTKLCFKATRSHPG
eukprot:139219-Chlamydomonas_euryale.AAC.2